MRIKPVFLLILLTGCNPTSDTNERASINALDAQHRATALEMQVRDLRARIETLEANDKVDSKNISILFRSRDALVKVQDLDYKANKEAFEILRRNDKNINANAGNPLPVVDD